MYYKNEMHYDYPERCDAHMIEVKHVRDVKIDAEYPYLDKRRRFKFMRGLYWLLVNVIVFPLCRLTHGLRIHGKENIKKNKALLAGGAISISNHVFYFDYLCVLRAIRPRLAYFPAWKTNFEGPCGKLIRLSGGIPVPTDSARAMRLFNGAIEEVLESGKWLHFYPEGSMWFFYPDIRPFKKAVFQYAVRFNKPILPIAMSFRPRRGITRLFSKKPFVDLHIGAPILPDASLTPREAAEQMRREAYDVMQRMCGITPNSPTYNVDQNPTHYRKTM